MLVQREWENIGKCQWIKSKPLSQSDQEEKMSDGGTCKEVCTDAGVSDCDHTCVASKQVDMNTSEKILLICKFK